jgi:hypothetical protein
VSAAQQLLELCVLSRLLWEAALESAERDGDQSRIHAVEAAAETALDAWRDALDLVEAGDLAGARRELLEARWQAAQWGDDATEREALDALREACQ